MGSTPDWIQPRPGEHFAWSEFINVRPGWTVVPDETAQRNIVALCTTVLDPLRRHLGRPVRISRGGGFRSVPYNRHIGGSKNSQHTLGEAGDIDVADLDAKGLVRVAVELELPCDQLISYAPNTGGHVHVSHTQRRANRGEVLHCWRDESGRKRYARWRP
jgi:hypothetical protein